MTSELVTENRAIEGIHTSHMKNKRVNIYVALESLDFVWDEKDVVDIEKLWKMGYSIHFISAEFGRSINDVFALLWDRLEKGFIKKRPGGVFGMEGMKI